MSKKKTTNQFIEEAKKIHNDKYDYSKVEYINTETKVCIICKQHGEFWQKPYKHLQGQGCIKCARELDSKRKMKNKDFFIEKAQNIHNGKYDYSKVEYKGIKNKSIIICPIHGEFKQALGNHLEGKGCPICGHIDSKNETYITTFIKNNIEIIENSKNILQSKQELDIFIPSKNIAIEYNGLRWHSELFNKDKWYHLNKTLECNKQDIKLLQIFEDEFIEHKDIILNKISHIIGIQQDLPKIMGRKCKIEVINNKTAELFLNDYHIQGFAPSTVYLGAIYENNLIGVMTFKQETKGSDKWELTRFASDYHYICQGVGGKLFNWFIKNYKPSEVKSFADRRWTLDKKNNLYTKLGFKLEKELNPDYRYYHPDLNKYMRFHKFNYRKQILHRKYGFPLSMTENEMTKEIKAYKIWDCGLFKFLWTKKE